MKFNQNPVFRTEDFPGQQDWISKLFIQINPLVQLLNQIFDNNISFGDNIRSVTRSYSISTFQAFGILWPYQNFPPVDLRIMSANKGTGQTPTVLLPYWSYNPSTQVISISNILEVTTTGISALSGAYNFTIRATV